MICLILILHRWVDPEFEDEEDMSEEVEEATSTEGEVAVESEDNREVVDNLTEDEEAVVVEIEMEELQPLKAKQ